jgi:hypothetical protein
VLRSLVRLVFISVMLVAPAAAAQATDSLPDSTAQRLAQLERELEALRLELRRQAALLEQHDVAAMGQAAQEPGRVPDQRVGRVSGIASRPFVYRGASAAVGGYVDLEFARDYGANTTTFTQHRVIPFIFAEISDRLHFGTELEFEYGGPNAGATDDGEVKVEFAAFDLNIANGLNFRAGALLSPLGKFNLIHDSPVNDLTDRPLVDNRLLPTTLTEAGVGIWGQVYPSAGTVLTYEAYIVNGFNNRLIEYEADAPGALAASYNVREARGSMRNDNNTAKSLVGRLAFAPTLGVELGASVHTGRYGDAGRGGLTIAALDAVVTRGRWEFLGELAHAGWTRDEAHERARAEGAYSEVAGDTVGFGAAYAGVRRVAAQQGAYAQLNIHFGRGVLGFANSTFTAIMRVDHLDLDTDTDGDLQQRLSVGLNWRPIEQSAIKIDYQWNWATAPGSTTAERPTRRLVASVASYF